MLIILIIFCLPFDIEMIIPGNIKLCDRNLTQPLAEEEIYPIFKLRIFQEKTVIPILTNIIEKSRSYSFHVVFFEPAIIQNVVIIASPILNETKFINLGVFDNVRYRNRKFCSPSLSFSLHRESLLRFAFKWKSAAKPNTKCIKFNIYLQFFIDQNFYKWRKFSDIRCYSNSVKDDIDLKMKENERQLLTKSCCIQGTPLYWLQIFTSSDSANISWNSLIGVSHNQKFKNLNKEYLKENSSGLFTICSGNGFETLEKEIKTATKSDQILNIIKSQGIPSSTQLNGRSALFSVDANHHMISLVTVASNNNQKVCYHIDNFSLCDNNCKWKNDFVVTFTKVNIKKYSNSISISNNSLKSVNSHNQNAFLNISEPFVKYSMSHYLGNNNFEYF